MSDYKQLLHAISQPTVAAFNKELKEYSDQGYGIYLSPSIAMTSYYNDQDEAQVVKEYFVLLSKTIELPADADKSK